MSIPPYFRTSFLYDFLVHFSFPSSLLYSFNVVMLLLQMFPSLLGLGLQDCAISVGRTEHSLFLHLLFMLTFKVQSVLFVVDPCKVHKSIQIKWVYLFVICPPKWKPEEVFKVLLPRCYVVSVRRDRMKFYVHRQLFFFLNS